ncbi:hypothetical protein F4859DRAFT_519349 [Xylaria cf. heliscus]|nr:hypothetical protein F4859DRAFT_519349 [Xylaria cf. heliscus]
MDSEGRVEHASARVDWLRAAGDEAALARMGRLAAFALHSCGGPSPSPKAEATPPEAMVPLAFPKSESGALNVGNVTITIPIPSSPHPHPPSPIQGTRALPPMALRCIRAGARTPRSALSGPEGTRSDRTAYCVLLFSEADSGEALLVCIRLFLQDAWFIEAWLIIANATTALYNTIVIGKQRTIYIASSSLESSSYCRYRHAVSLLCVMRCATPYWRPLRDT